MSRHIIDDRTEHLDARMLKKFGEFEQKQAGAPGDQAKLLHRQKRGGDRSRARNYARIEREGRP